MNNTDNVFPNLFRMLELWVNGTYQIHKNWATTNINDSTVEQAYSMWISLYILHLTGVYSCHEPYLQLLLLSWLSWHAYFPSGVVSRGSQKCNSPYKSHTVHHKPFSSREVCLNHIRSQSILYYSIHIFSLKQLHV